MRGLDLESSVIKYYGPDPNQADTRAVTDVVYPVSEGSLAFSLRANGEPDSLSDEDRQVLELARVGLLPLAPEQARSHYAA